MDIRKLFGRNLRHYRLAANLSQEAVGAKMGVDRAYVGLMERGEQNVTLLTIWGVCEALDLRPADLFSEAPIADVEDDQPSLD